VSESLQDRYAPNNRCFGCGPANEKGLRIKSFVEDDEVVCTWQPETHHEAYTNMLNGGICGCLLDCHSNWTAAHHLMHVQNRDTPPATVTAEFHVKLMRPTPTDEPLQVRARVASSTKSRAEIEARIIAGGHVTATCRGVFVSVEEGHPAFHRW
jgi:acyl-coenzyme A thioesterase PaaI-like protein